MGSISYTRVQQGVHKCGSLPNEDILMLRGVNDYQYKMTI